MGKARVLVTGAFGSVGAHVVEHLHALGFAVVATDLGTPATQARAAWLAHRAVFTTVWCDLTDPVAVADLVVNTHPDAVVHVAAIIAPVAFAVPALARRVNVEATATLLAAVRTHTPRAVFVFTSSYNVHGPRNPHREPGVLTADTPFAPVDSYSRHKVEGERMVRASGLVWSILRLPAVLPLDPAWGRHPAFLPYAYLLPLDRREHALDARDAGLALARAVDTPEAHGRVWMIGGPDDSCRVTGAELTDALFAARGLSSLPARAFRVVDRQIDGAWPAEDWVETAASQAVLRYQQHGLDDHVRSMRAMAPWWTPLARVAWPVARQAVVQRSPYPSRGDEAASTWALACRTWGLDPALDADLGEAVLPDAV